MFAGNPNNHGSKVTYQYTYIETLFKQFSSVAVGERRHGLSTRGNVPSLRYRVPR